jgi:hypothetical protein
MWVIFRDPISVFRDMDKYILCIVEDKDILVFQEHLWTSLGGRKQEIYSNNPYLQPLVITEHHEYYARKYIPWDSMTPQIDNMIQSERKVSDTPKVLKTPVLERRNPCNTSQ